MAERSDSAGTVSVGIVGEVEIDQESLAAAAREAAAATAREMRQQTERGSARRGARDTAPVDVEAKVKAKVEGKGGSISKDIQSAIDKTEYQLTIDTDNIRRQIEVALQKPFQIIIDAEVRGAQAAAGVGVTHGATVAAGAPMSRGPIPGHLEQRLSQTGKEGTTLRPFAMAIDNLYRNINEALQASGRGRFGSQPLDPGNRVEKAIEMIDAFGERADQWFTTTKKGPVERVTGGSVLDFLKAQGVDLASGEVTALKSNAGGLRGDQRRSQELFFAKLAEWTRENPMVAQPAAAVAPTVNVAPTPAFVPKTETPTAAAQETELRAARQAVIAERQASLAFNRIDPSRFQGLGPIPFTPAGPRPPSERIAGSSAFGKGFIGPLEPLEEGAPADVKARRDLGGNNRANVRRLRARGPNANVAGLQFPLEPFLRLAEMGGFQDVFEQFTGKGFNESQGFGQLTPSDVGGFAELTRLRGLKPGVKRTIAGQEGKFRRLNPSEAFARTVIGAAGVEEDQPSAEAIRGFLDQPEIAQSIRQAIERGGSPLRGGARETKRGQGRVSISGGAADLGAEAKRLFEWIDTLDGKIADYSETLDNLNRDIERSAGTGQDVRGLEGQARSLSGQIREFRTQRAEAQRQQKEMMTPVTATDVQTLRAAAEARGETPLGSKSVIEQGIGLTGAERQSSESETLFRSGASLFGSRATGTRLKALVEAGELPKPEVIAQMLQSRFLGRQERIDPATGNVITGTRAMREVAFGPSGRARRSKGPDDDTGLFGELTGMLPADAGPNVRREAQSYIKDILRNIIGDEGFKRGLMETDVRRREQMSGPRKFMGDVGPEEARRHGYTGEGQFRFAPGTQAALEVDIARQEEKIAALRAAAEAERRSRKAGSGQRARDLEAEAELLTTGGFATPTTPPEDRVTGLNEMRARLATAKTRQDLEEAEFEKRETTAARTQGRGRYQTGDQARDVARGLGVTMESEERVPPFAALNREINVGAAAGGGGGGGRRPTAAGAGGGGGDFFGEVSGPIHVIVDNTPLAVTWSGQAPEEPRTRRRRGAPTEDAEEAPTRVSETRTAQRQRELRRKAMPTRDLGTVIDPNKIYTFDPLLDEQKEIAARERARARTGRERAPTAAETDFVAALQQANDPRRAAAEERAREAEARRQRRVARVNDPVGFAGAQDVEDARQRELRGQLRSINRRVPRRGFGASLTDLITSFVGSGALETQLEAADLATREATEISQVSKQRAATRTTRRGLIGQIREERVQGRAGGERESALLEQFREQVVLGRQQNAVIRESTTRFKQFHAEATNATTVLKSFGAAAVGSIGSIGVGALTFGLGSAIAAPLITAVAEGVTQGLGPALEKATGFAGTTARVTATAADEIRARGGDVGAVSGIAARTGLGAATFERISPLLIDRAQVEAGNRAIQEQLDLLKTFENLQRDRQGRPFDTGLSRTTGGFLGTPLFGIPSTAEQLGGALGGLPGVRTQEADTRIAELQRQLDSGPMDGRRRQALMGQILQLSQGQTADTLTDEQVGLTNERLGLFNDLLEKGGSNMRLFSDATGKAAEQTAKAAEEAGLPELADTFRERGVGIRGVRTSDDLQSALAAINRGATTPSPRLLLEETRRQREAQIGLEDQTRDFNLQTVIPQQTAIAFAQRPLAPAAAGINLSGVSSSVRKGVNADLAQTQELYNQINAEVATGLDQAKDFVSQTFAYDPNVGKEFAASLDRVVSLGKQISGIEIGLQTKQAAFQAAQFSYQINIAKRSLADAKGLAGELTGASKENLGVLERETFLLQRRAQAMQLELSQRQINFQRAVAGFTAPGLTGEERAARIQQAKIEADFAQKQLNIQKELAGLEGRKFEISADRQVADLTQQLSLLEKGRVITLETAAAEKKIRALTAIQERENKKVQAFYEAAVQRTNDIMQLEAQLVAATGKAMNQVATDVLKAFRSTYIGMLTTINNSIGNTVGRDDEIPGAGRHAGGNVMEGQSYWVGEHGKKELFTPGENGTITPLSMISGQSGGGSAGGDTVINIFVTGNNVSSEEELKKLEARITRAVEEAQNRKLTLLGGRNY